MKEELTINLQPDPQVLIAITNNPMRPIDAICELIDNSIDSFLDAERSGHPIDSPTIIISLPKTSEIEKGEGSVSILDNGVGLTLAQAGKALKAGYTSRNKFGGTLGVFGMGFNISTGKLGKHTVFRTATIKESEMIEVTIDLERMVRTNTYDVPAIKKPKSPPNFHGTLITISGWWPQGNQNFGFASKLVRLGIINIRDEIGRRYYPILRNSKIRIFVNDEICKPYEHCVWSEHRAIKHRELGLIPAGIQLNQIIYTQTCCSKCGRVLDENFCPECGKGVPTKTAEEFIGGWVGIQRFDDKDNFGIDLIRNGRVIRKLEKDAFFNWIDSRGRTIKDYPVDSIFGRIVGEVHLDHVPTDFLKQDFQRTSSEWARAMSYLRGDSSLQPKIASEAGEPPNNSPIYKLYQGYRRVRDIGSKDMYMGYWEPGQDQPKRISREVEVEYYQRFLNKEPGFYDDSEWWKLVEQADTKPPVDVKECPQCAFQCLNTADTCQNCGYVFISKTCINRECNAEIAISAVVCPHCGSSQEIHQQDRWKCAFCSRSNPPNAFLCVGCGRARGEVNQMSLEYLTSHSNKNDDLSLEAFSMPLPDNVTSDAFNVDVYSLGSGVTLERDGVALPLITFKENGIKIFIDTCHPFFTEYQQNIETLISIEIAKYIQESNARHMVGDKAHLWSISSLCWQISRLYWKERLSVDPDVTRRRAEEFFDKLRYSLPELLLENSKEIYESMTPRQQGDLVQTVIQNGYKARDLSGLVETGKFLSFIDNRTIVNILEKYPSSFFDEHFWSDDYLDLPIDDPATIEQIRNLILSRYRNFLEDILGFLEFKQKDTAYTVRADHTLRLLNRGLT